MTLALKAIGAVSPVGDDATSTFAALRAGVAGLAEHPYFALRPVDPDWDPEDPLKAGVVPTIDGDLEGPARLAALALAALRDLVKQAALTRAELSSSALLLALPEAGPDVQPWDLGGAFVRELLSRAGLEAPVAIHVDQTGHTGALALLGFAHRLLSEQRTSRCILLGADTYCDAGRLRQWDEHRGRLRSSRSLDGFLPGEAAVVLLLEAPGGERPARALVHAPSFGNEPNPIEGDKAPTGKGMTDAVRGALRALPADAPVSCVYADLNGESRRAFEWGLVRVRLAPRLDETPLVHPADCIGDVGAASGALLLGLAAHAFSRDPVAGSEALVTTSSTAGIRGATLISRER